MVLLSLEASVAAGGNVLLQRVLRPNLAGDAPHTIGVPWMGSPMHFLKTFFDASGQ